MAESIDLSSLDSAARADEGARLHLVHPTTNEELGISLHLAGIDSAAHRRAVSIAANRRAKGGFRKQVTLEQVQEESIETLAACTLAWEGVRVDGKELAFSHAAAVSLYTRFPWLREQAEQFISDRANYLQD
jgi:hypothetical protein